MENGSFIQKAWGVCRISRGEALCLFHSISLALGVYATLICFFGIIPVSRIPLGREEGMVDTVTLPYDLSFLRLRALNRLRGGLGWRGKIQVEVLSSEPKAFLYHNFMSKEECEYLTRLPKYYEASYVNLPPSGAYNGTFVASGILGKRPLLTASVERGKYKVIQDIEKRIADLTFIPPENGEGLQLINYKYMASYYPHFDYFTNESDVMTNGGQRIATMIIYLSDSWNGGETVFPAARGNFRSMPGRDQLSKCGEQGLAVKPKQGDALFFWNVKPDGTPDPSSLHGSCPNLNRWGRRKWICVKRLRAHEHKV